MSDDMEPTPDTLLRMQRQINDMFERLSKVEAGGVEAKVAPFDPDVIAANLKAIDHEINTPMRGHGECCPTERTDWLDEPAPVPRPEPAPADVDPDVIAADLEALKHELETPMRGHGECCDPAPADVDPDEALADVLEDAYHHSNIGDWLSVARAAREHIEAERIDTEVEP